MDEESSIDDQILKHLEELTIGVIIGELHHEMMVMSSSQYIIYPHEPNEVLEEHSFSGYNLDNSVLYDCDEVHSQAMSFPHDAFYFHLDY